MSAQEYRAVFTGPHGEPSGVSEVVATLEEALAQRPARAEESLAVLAGVDVRNVEPWRPVALTAIIAAAQDGHR